MPAVNQKEDKRTKNRSRAWSFLRHGSSTRRFKDIRRHAPRWPHAWVIVCLQEPLGETRSQLKGTHLVYVLRTAILIDRPPISRPVLLVIPPMTSHVVPHAGKPHNLNGGSLSDPAGFDPDGSSDRPSLLLSGKVKSEYIRIHPTTMTQCSVYWAQLRGHSPRDVRSSDAVKLAYWPSYRSILHEYRQLFILFWSRADNAISGVARP